MNSRIHSHLIAPGLASLLLASLSGSCAGPAGVRPQQGSQVVLRSCTIDQNMISGKSDILIEAGNCPVLTFVGEPLTLNAGQQMTIPQSPKININGTFSVTGTLFMENTRIVGPGHLIFGTEANAPEMIRIENSFIGADEAGQAPALTLFGSVNADCTSDSARPAYDFSTFTVEALAGNTVNMLNMPSSLSGMVFSENQSAPFTARLGDLCIPAGSDYALSAGPLTYEAGSLKVMGRLTLPGSHLVLSGAEGLTVDGGTLVSKGAKDVAARIDFKPDTPVTSRRLTLRNRANGSLSHTQVTSGSILVSGSDLVINDSKISGACADSDDADCKKPENRAAITVSDGGKVDLTGSELLPKGETQILVQDDSSGNSARPQVTTSGNADDYKVATMDGRPFHVSRVLPLIAGTHISKQLRNTLEDLTGTYESPCMSSEQNENNSFRRVFTFDNEIVPLQDSLTIFTPVRLKFVRTIINYEGAGCDIPAYTSHMAGTATYYILRGKPDDAGNTPESLANRVYYKFGQLVWTYHNPNVIQTLNDQNFCEVNTWQVNVPQDVTHKKCFGDGFRLHGYHDRFEVREDRDLHLALDFDDRPDDLKDLIPAAVSKETVYRRK